ncbi:glycosyltransferase [Rossellomorea sp. KS-H15a]|uniref:glycosyltransferase n=1 Tax=Rossellomorea sp. KS-H15a TaxID=2963940 RepID=UPI0020C6BCA6|nr:glycosyltransferase [Rossellomorea sp. KS-H15a]UTE75471.1 glycosyltransferase [Rossellomorea sp. KS-H15a]
MESKVSIIIPFYNCRYIDQAITSAINQDYSNKEIIVVDDGSTLYTEKLVPFIDRIQYINKKNGGTATALNAGINASKGDYIAWLSSDDIFLPGKISKQLAKIKDSSTLANFTAYNIIDENNKIVYPGLPQSYNNSQVKKEFLQRNLINGSTVMVHQKIFKNIGLFNNKLRYTQDYDMWFRILVNGYDFSYTNEVLTHFRRHQESGTSKHKIAMLNEVTLIENFYRPILLKSINK